MKCHYLNRFCDKYKPNLSKTNSCTISKEVNIFQIDDLFQSGIIYLLISYSTINFVFYQNHVVECWEGGELRRNRSDRSASARCRSDLSKTVANSVHEAAAGILGDCFRTVPISWYVFLNLILDFRLIHFHWIHYFVRRIRIILINVLGFQNYFGLLLGIKW